MPAPVSGRLEGHEIGDATIRLGDGVLIDIGAANHDERVFSGPVRASRLEELPVAW